MIDKTAVKKIRALVTVRAVFITLLLGSFVLLQIGYRSFQYPQATLNLIIALYSLTILYAVLLRIIKHHHALFVYSQLFLDVIAANVLIFLTGGIESWFSFILPLTVLSASIVMNKKAGYITATLNSIFYGTIINFQYYQILSVRYEGALTEKDFLYNIFVNISALYLVAFLSGYLSSRLEKTSEELKQTDADLKKLALFNRELIESIPSGVFTADIYGSILIFNRAAENITGIERRIVYGRKITEILPFLKNLDDTNRTEGRINHYREGEKILGVTISLLTDTNGEKTGLIGIFQDITAFKKMESEIKNKEKWAAIGELSANIAHEIRNPLASLRGSVEMLIENKLRASEKEKLMNIALKEMERLNKTITDFLTFSNPKPIEFEAVNLNNLLDETLELLKNVSAAKNSIAIQKDFGNDLQITADSQKLRQVFWNLATNAIEAMSSGGELLVSTRRTEDFVEIVFQDSGVGISKDNLSRIFYPFYTTKQGGTGLGLAISYRIIEEHNGTITVTSNRDSGTIFRVLLPNGNGIYK